uniref:Armadillo repeat-containing protein 8 n=1 Tax=Parastrongyloides trichosuri TaxID=131310 RepID=A0A0N5A3J0_PARTI
MDKIKKIRSELTETLSYDEINGVICNNSLDDQELLKVLNELKDIVYANHYNELYKSNSKQLKEIMKVFELLTVLLSVKEYSIRVAASNCLDSILLSCGTSNPQKVIYALLKELDKNHGSRSMEYILKRLTYFFKDIKLSVVQKQCKAATIEELIFEGDSTTRQMLHIMEIMYKEIESIDDVIHEIVKKATMLNDFKIIEQIGIILILKYCWNKLIEDETIYVKLKCSIESITKLLGDKNHEIALVALEFTQKIIKKSKKLNEILNCKINENESPIEILDINDPLRNEENIENTDNDDEEWTPKKHFSFSNKKYTDILIIILNKLSALYLNNEDKYYKVAHQIMAIDIINEILEIIPEKMGEICENIDFKNISTVNDKSLQKSILLLALKCTSTVTELSSSNQINTLLLNLLRDKDIASKTLALSLILPHIRKIIYNRELLNETIICCQNCDNEDNLTFQKICIKILCSIPWKYSPETVAKLQQKCRKIFVKYLCHTNRKIVIESKNNLNDFLNNGENQINGSNFFELEMPKSLLSPYQINFTKTMNLPKYFDFVTRPGDSCFASNLVLLLEEIIEYLDDSESDYLDKLILALLSLIEVAPIAHWKDAWIPFLVGKCGTRTNIISMIYEHISFEQMNLQQLSDSIELSTYILAGISETDFYECFLNGEKFDFSTKSTIGKVMKFEDSFKIPLKTMNLYYTIITASATNKSLIKQAVFDMNNENNSVTSPTQPKLNAQFQKLHDISKFLGHGIRSKLKSNFFDSHNETMLLQNVFGAYENFCTNIDSESRQKFLNPLTKAIDFMNCYLELASLNDFLYIMDELIMYIKIFLSICPVEAVSLVHQILKVMFSKNAASMKLIDFQPPVDFYGFNFLDEKGIYLDQPKNKFSVYGMTAQKESIIEWSYLDDMGFLNNQLFETQTKDETLDISNNYLRSLDVIFTKILQLYAITEDISFRGSVISLMNQFDHIGLDYNQADKGLVVYNSIIKYCEKEFHWSSEISQPILVFLTHRTLYNWKVKKIFPKILHPFIKVAENRTDLQIISSFLTLISLLPLPTAFDIMMFTRQQWRLDKWFEVKPLESLHIMAKFGPLKKYLSEECFRDLINHFKTAYEKCLSNGNIVLSDRLIMTTIAVLKNFWSNELEEWCFMMIIKLTNEKKWPFCSSFVYGIVWFSNESYKIEETLIQTSSEELASSINYGIHDVINRIRRNYLSFKESQDYDFSYSIILQSLNCSLGNVKRQDFVKNVLKNIRQPSKEDIEIMAVYLPRIHYLLFLYFHNFLNISQAEYSVKEWFVDKFQVPNSSKHFKTLVEILKSKNEKEVKDKETIQYVNYIFSDIESLEQLILTSDNITSDKQIYAFFKTLSVLKLELSEKVITAVLKNIDILKIQKFITIGSNIFITKLITERGERMKTLFCLFTTLMWQTFNDNYEEMPTIDIIYFIYHIGISIYNYPQLSDVCMNFTSQMVHKITKRFVVYAMKSKDLNDIFFDTITFFLTSRDVMDEFEKTYISLEYLPPLALALLTKKVKDTNLNKVEMKLIIEYEDESLKYLKTKVKAAFKVTANCFNFIKQMDEENKLSVSERKAFKSVLRCSVLYEFALIPTTAHLFNYETKVTLTKKKIVFKFISIHMLNSIEVVTDFSSRISWLGWKDRRQFEDFWMSLFGVLSSTPCGEELKKGNKDDIQEQLASSSIAVDALTNNLLQSFLYPVQGDTVNGKYPVRSPIINVNKEHLSYLKQSNNICDILMKKSFNIFDDDIYVDKYDLCQVTLYHVWVVTNVLEKTGIRNENNETTVHEGDNTVFPRSVSNYMIKMTDDLDTNSSLKALLDNFSHWFSKGVEEMPLNLLTSTIRSIVLLSDLFDDVGTYRTIYLQLKCLLEIEDYKYTPISGYLLYFLLKYFSIVGIEFFDTTQSESEIINFITNIVEKGLQSTYLFTKYCLYSGCIFLCQSYTTDKLSCIIEMISEDVYKEIMGTFFNKLPEFYQERALQLIFSIENLGTETKVLTERNISKIIVKYFNDKNTSTTVLFRIAKLTMIIISYSNTISKVILDNLYSIITRIDINIQIEKLNCALCLFSKALCKTLECSNFSNELIIKLQTIVEIVLSYISKIPNTEDVVHLGDGIFELSWLLPDKNMILDLLIDQIIISIENEKSLQILLHLVGKLFERLYQENTKSDAHNILLLVVSTMSKMKLITDYKKSIYIMKCLFCAGNPDEMIRSQIYWNVLDIENLSPNYEKYLFTSILTSLDKVRIDKTFLINSMKRVIKNSSDEVIDINRLHAFL